jgi:integrase
LKGHTGFKDGKKGKSYYYKFSVVNAKGKRQTVMKRGFTSDEEAQNAQIVAMAGYITGEVPASRGKTTLLEYVRKWLREKRGRRTSLSGYRNIVENHISNDPISGKLVSELKYSDIKCYYARRRETGLGENTLRRHQAILRPLLDEAIKDELLVNNPAKLVKLESFEEYEAETYDEELVILMLDELRDEDIYPCVVLAIELADRRGEALGSTWTNTDLDQKTLKIMQAYYVVDGEPGYDPVKTKKSKDTVCLTDFAVTELKHIRKEQIKMRLQIGAAFQDNDLICCQSDGTPWNPSTVSKKFSNVLKRHGLPHIRFHDLRHSHATIMYENGADIKQIADDLRHTTLQMADRYTHPTIEKKRKTLQDCYERPVHGQKNTPRHQRGDQA